MNRVAHRTTPGLPTVEAMTDPTHPRDFFEVPQAFGAVGAKLRDDLGQDRRVRDRATAAVHQHRVVQSIHKLTRHGSLKKTALSKASGISSRRLSRVLTGEAWMHLYDLVALGRVLGLDLVQVRVIDDLTFEASWASGPGDRSTGDAQVARRPAEASRHVVR